MLRGREVHSPSVDVGIVFQEPTLLPWKTTLDNITLPVRLLGKPMELYNDRARQLMDAVGLHGFADSRPGQLSGGMKQRAAICRALINDAPILLIGRALQCSDAKRATKTRSTSARSVATTEQDGAVHHAQHSGGVFLSDRIIVMSARPSTSNRCGRPDSLSSPARYEHSIRSAVRRTVPRPQDHDLSQRGSRKGPAADHSVFEVRSE